MECMVLLSSLTLPLHSQSRLLDDCDALSGWRPIVSEGAKLSIVGGEGKSGGAMAMDFELLGVYGYVIAEKDFTLDLPPNYQFTFDLKADIPVNNFEFKLVDDRENVFWIKKLNVQYPKTWERQRIKKRHITFAWGPSGGGEIHAVRKIQFVVSSGAGGKGRVLIDNFRFEPVDDSAAQHARTIVDASSMAKGGEPMLSTEGTVVTGWRSAGGPSEWIAFDFSYLREVGGFVIDWAGDRYATAYDVLLSDDGTEWTTAYAVTDGNGGRDYIYLPEKDARFAKILCKAGKAGGGYAIARLEVKGSSFSTHPNDFFSAIAQESPKGLYPQYFMKRQSFWTVVGTSGDDREALINEQGAIEVDKLGFTLEPFLYLNDSLITWADVSLTQSLEKDYLPIPSVHWKAGGWEMTVRAFSAGVAGNSLLIATYRLENRGGVSPGGKLFIALRPFQVNPPWQWLNQVGGATRIDSIRTDNGLLLVNDKTVIPLIAPSGFGAAGFDNGDITDFLRRGDLPPGDHALDTRGFASGALRYDFNIPSGTSREFHVVVPFHRWTGSPAPNMRDGADIYVNMALDATRQFWEAKLDRVRITLPPPAQPIINTIKANLAYIFINRDGPGIQPGSRSYERSWIRDGSLTSTALLELGIRDEVREFVDWYAQYQFPGGKIPCVVDTRGGDPTNEHDSHGQFIYSVMSYFNFTHDTTWLRSKFDHVVKTVRYLQSLRAERKTDLYRNGTPEQRACFGLVPESISHEGYWSKPMHSYWDDFFVMRGLKDAAAMARILGESEYEHEFAAERDDFRKDLYASMRLAMKNAGIDYIPGCVELGDFDATSTTVGVSPCNELGNIPEPQLHNTFDRYYEFFVKRRDGKMEWKDYTPYENRIIGTFVYLDQKQRAHDLVDFFMKDRRPAGWNHWAEVVHRDRSAPRYIGDMPHTWCGSDFIRSVRAMFVYERESDTSLVVGAGLADAWVNDPAGVDVGGLPTYYGTISYTVRKTGRTVTVQMGGDIRIPPGKIVLKSPLSKRIRSVLMNGKKSTSWKGSDIIITKLPSRIAVSY